MEEIWKDVKDYEEYYEVSNMGRVRSKNRRVRWGNNSFLKQGRILSQKKDHKHYLIVCLSVNGVAHNKFVHRLAAEAFIPKDDPSKNVVNHKDFNPQNNNVSNLEWTTINGNNRYSADRGRYKRTPEVAKRLKAISVKKQGKPVYGVNTENGFIFELPYMGIAREYGLAPTSICNCCKRRYHYYSYKGYKWFYGMKRNQS